MTELIGHTYLFSLAAAVGCVALGLGVALVERKIFERGWKL